MTLPIKNLFTALMVTAVIITGGGWAASHLGAPRDAVAGENTASAADGAEQAIAGLRLHLEGVRNDKGSIIIMIFDTAAGYNSYDYQKAAVLHEVAAASGNMRVDFPALTGGPYAVVLFHDENGDYDLNMAGDYPMEGYGTSNARGPYDEPDFKRASTETGEVTITVHYLY